MPRVYITKIVKNLFKFSSAGSFRTIDLNYYKKIGHNQAINYLKQIFQTKLCLV